MTANKSWGTKNNICFGVDARQVPAWTTWSEATSVAQGVATGATTSLWKPSPETANPLFPLILSDLAQYQVAQNPSSC